VSESIEAPAEVAKNPDTSAPAARSKFEAWPQRSLCAGVGVALFVAFGLPWIQLTEAAIGRHSGLELAIDGAQSGSSHAILFVLPVLGGVLLATAWWGRRRACMGALLATGLLVLLGGAWQTLLYVAAAIGPGLWVVAATGLVALVGGLPWRAIIERQRAS
jgi:hypothetical protein